MSLEHSSARAARRLGFGRISRAVQQTGLSRSLLYQIATQHPGLFKKAGSATIVNLDMLDEIIAELPNANINISSASKPDAT